MKGKDIKDFMGNKEGFNLFIIGLLKKNLKGEINSSFKAEPEGERIEFYLAANKGGAAYTVFAASLEGKIVEIYSILREKNEALAQKLVHLFSSAGFEILQRDKI